MQADRTCQKRMDELASRAAQGGIVQLTSFCTPSELVQADISARQEGVFLKTWGGVEDAERRVAAFCPYEEDNPIWPVVTVQFAWNPKFGTIQHRDVLGSLMALGMDREKFGDVFISHGAAYAIMHKDIATYVLSAIEKIGNTTVSAKLLEEIPTITTTTGESIRCTVASVRLDALLGAVFKLSRSRAQELVASGKVQVDYCITMRPDAIIKENMTISVRGLGRCKLVEISGKTKKDRICVMLKRF